MAIFFSVTLQQRFLILCRCLRNQVVVLRAKWSQIAELRCRLKRSRIAQVLRWPLNLRIRWRAIQTRQRNGHWTTFNSQMDTTRQIQPVGLHSENIFSSLIKHFIIDFLCSVSLQRTWFVGFWAFILHVNLIQHHRILQFSNDGFCWCLNINFRNCSKSWRCCAHVTYAESVCWWFGL